VARGERRPRICADDVTLSAAAHACGSIFARGVQHLARRARAAATSGRLVPQRAGIRRRQQREQSMATLFAARCAAWRLALGGTSVALRHGGGDSSLHLASWIMTIMLAVAAQMPLYRKRHRCMVVTARHRCEARRLCSLYAWVLGSRYGWRHFATWAAMLLRQSATPAIGAPDALRRGAASCCTRRRSACVWMNARGGGAGAVRGVVIELNICCAIRDRRIALSAAARTFAAAYDVAHLLKIALNINVRGSSRHNVAA